MKMYFLRLLMVAAVLGAAAPSHGETKNSSTATATSPPSQVAAPQIQFAEELFDFGKVNAGEMVRHDFVFTNAGTTTLEIKEVRPGCGCTTAGTWDRQVEPGKTGVIPLQFNSAAFGGQVTKPATVICNDPIRSNVVLKIAGTVLKAIEITPLMAVFNVSSETATNVTRVVRIVNNLEEPLELSELQCTNKAFQAELKAVRPGKEFELHITAVPPFEVPSVTAPVSLKTSSPRTPTIKVTAFLTAQSPVMVTPNQIFLPAGPLTNAVHSLVTIRNAGTNSLVLSDAHFNVPGVNVRVQEIQAGRVFSLALDFPVGFQIKPDQKAELTVKSNHPKFALIQVPAVHSQAAALRAPAPGARIIGARPVLPVPK